LTARILNVYFHYPVEADGDATSDHATQWFDPNGLPRTTHGRWERDAVSRVLDATLAV
jgi:hypothetical protein